jgi:hypothetical protein
MNPEVIKLMADLERYRNLRSSIIDEKAKEDLDHRTPPARTAWTRWER